MHIISNNNVGRKLQAAESYGAHFSFDMTLRMTSRSRICSLGDTDTTFDTTFKGVRLFKSQVTKVWRDSAGEHVSCS